MTSDARWGLSLLSGCAAALLLLAGCSKRTTQETPPAAAQQPPRPATFNSHLMLGADQAAIRSYLQSVHEVKPKKFEVQWSADTVPVSREEALRSLRAVSRDGNSYSFVSSEPVVQKLQPGRIVWIWDLTVARIDRVGTLDDTTTIHTVPIPLSEALPRADIEFEAPLDFGTAISRVVPRSKTPDSAWKNVAAYASRSPFRHVRYQGSTEGSPPPGANNGSNQNGSGGNAPSTENSTEQTEKEDLVAGTGDGYNGEIAGFEYELKYLAGGSKLEFELEARKMEEGSAAATGNEVLRDQRYEFYQYVAEQRDAEHEAEEAHDRQLELTKDLSRLSLSQGPAQFVPANASAADKAGAQLLMKKDQEELKEATQKYAESEERAKAAKENVERLSQLGALARQVFFIVSDNLDIRFRARANIDAMSVAATIMTSQGGNAGTSVAFKNMRGTLDLEFVARLGEKGTGGVNLPVAHIPVMFNVPLPIGGLPFIVQVGGDYLVKVGLSGRHAAHHFHAKFSFDGSGGGFSASSDSQSNTNFALSESEPEVDEPVANSLGASGAVLAVQIPRLGLGMGVFGAAAMGYVDHIVVLTITNAPAIGMIPCKRVTLDRDAHVGADVTTILPIPVVETLLHALAWKKEVWHAEQWKKVEPDVPACRI
jgi:hypothetical protein